MSDPITVTTTPIYSTLTISAANGVTAESDIAHGGVALLASRKGVSFHPIGGDVWLSNSDGSGSMTIRAEDERAYIIDPTTVVTFYLQTSATSVTVEREERL